MSGVVPGTFRCACAKSKALGEPALTDRSIRSGVVPGIVLSESCKAFAFGERSASPADALAAKVNIPATVAASKRVFFMVDVLSAFCRRLIPPFVHFLGYAAANEIPQRNSRAVRRITHGLPGNRDKGNGKVARNAAANPLRDVFQASGDQPWHQWSLWRSETKARSQAIPPHRERWPLRASQSALSRTRVFQGPR